ncbi:hypothetical protein BI49514_00342 [Brevibacterium iodinum ATCC 49514]|uniref:Uncharacterized protein n=1 Tax=Brevibacterium iodinum ATCC 49514 TaxID=1255616 RepID=A0A2H1HVE0_9MICO|nr:hypothetical protein [Brevibacterium iodinum]SMX66881.1 hypothetical protein BI49514_00342 [Brevibacterium iodinum ATCC 49514]SUW13626.1 Uncharacterised protein [Brevibacterium iodinum]
MRVLFQGAGAIGIAGAALFTDAHEVAVVSRTAGPNGRTAFPRRVSTFDPTYSGQVGVGHGSCRERSGRAGGNNRGATGRENGGETGGAEGSQASTGSGWSVTRVAATRRVTITDWDHAAADGRWDLIVLTTRPDDLDAEVVSAIRDILPAFIATTSQVEGDLDRAQAVFPGAQAVIFGPAFLSERLDPGAPAEVVRAEGSRAGEADGGVLTTGGLDGVVGRKAEPGHEVTFWAPAGAPRFFVAGPSTAVRALVSRLGRLVLPVPMKAVLLPPTVFIPFVAELSVRNGSWVALKSHLDRPAKAASEAVRTRLGVPVPVFGSAAHVVLEAVERIVPIDVTNYAGRHFARHMGQTRNMLAGWAESADSAHALRELVAALDALVD